MVQRHPSWATSEVVFRRPRGAALHSFNGLLSHQSETWLGSLTINGRTNRIAPIRSSPPIIPGPRRWATTVKDGAPGTPPLKPPPRGIEPLPEGAQVASESGLSETRQDVLASCLALLCAEHPDLASVVAVWDALPGPVRAGIVAIVDVTLK